MPSTLPCFGSYLQSFFFPEPSSEGSFLASESGVPGLKFSHLYVNLHSVLFCLGRTIVAYCQYKGKKKQNPEKNYKEKGLLWLIVLRAPVHDGCGSAGVKQHMLYGRMSREAKLLILRPEEKKPRVPLPLSGGYSLQHTHTHSMI